MVEPIPVPHRRLTGDEILAREEFRALSVTDARTVSLRVGGVTFGRPTLRLVEDDGDRVVTLLDVPFDLDVVARRIYLRVRVTVRLDSSVIALSTWPRAANPPTETFGVDDDFRLVPSGSVLPLRHESLPRDVDSRASGAVLTWETTAGPVPTDGHRLFAVVAFPSGTTAVVGQVMAEVEIGGQGGNPGPIPPTVATSFSAPIATTDPESVIAPTPLEGDVSFRGRDIATRGRGDPPREPPTPPTQYVSSGFARPDRPEEPWPRLLALRPDTDYVYWFQIGDRQAGDVGERPIRFNPPPDVGAGTVLTVALFGFDGELELTEGADLGELQVLDDLTVGVLRQPGANERAVGERRLHFPVRTPDRVGPHRLRCNLYCGQTLLQSHLVRVEVGGSGRVRRGAVNSTVDYLFDAVLEPAALAEIRPITLSVFLNDDGDGGHSFRFLGHDGEAYVKDDVRIKATELQNAVDIARAELRHVSWTGGGEWREDVLFRYDRCTEPDFAKDLIELARRGHQLWAALSGAVVDGILPVPQAAPKRRLMALMRRPGTVEFGTKDGSPTAVPAALLYDYDLDTGRFRSDQASGRPVLTVCAAAMTAVGRLDPVELADQPCFRGECPDADDDTVVCPGGFWGFRHRIGHPQSRGGVEPDGREPGQGLTTISVSGRPHIVVGVANEFAGTHSDAVCARGDGKSRPAVDQRDLLLARLRETRTIHLVYLFCHGTGIEGDPGLRVGPRGTDPIDAAQVGDGRVYWTRPRPLVVLNGCRTAAVQPRFLRDFVKAFVDANAAGVLGTELTIVESLGEAFGDAFLDYWLVSGTGIGEAVRRARLDLLAVGNPLGLVYVPYAPADLRLQAT